MRMQVAVGDNTTTATNVAIPAGTREIKIMLEPHELDVGGISVYDKHGNLLQVSRIYVGAQTEIYLKEDVAIEKSNHTSFLSLLHDEIKRIEDGMNYNVHSQGLNYIHTQLHLLMSNIRREDGRLT